MISDYSKQIYIQNHLTNPFSDQSSGQIIRRNQELKRLRRIAIANPMARNSRTYSRTQSYNDLNSMPSKQPLQYYETPVLQLITNNPDMRKIIEAFLSTLGKRTDLMDSKDLFIIKFDVNQTLRQQLKPYREDVIQFCETLEFFSTLPITEQFNNQKKWLDVLILRSSWWFAKTNYEDNRQMIRITEKYVLQRDDNKQLDPLFSFAQTMAEMDLTETEISLAITYTLFLGTFSFLPTLNPNGKSLTAQRRDCVLNLLYNYQKKLFPSDPTRYVKLLTNLADLTYISGTA